MKKNLIQMQLIKGIIVYIAGVSYEEESYTNAAHLGNNCIYCRCQL